MENNQKRKLLTSIYRTINLFTIAAIGLVLYLVINKLVLKTNSILWLNVVIITLTAFLFICMLAEYIATRKIKNKYNIARFLFLLVFVTVVSLITLGVYCYVQNFDVTPYVSYVLPIGLVLTTQLLLIINLIIGLNITKLRKNSIITLDSTSDTPTFNDEIAMKKKLDELNRKLAMKKVQDEINSIQKKLDE